LTPLGGSVTIDPDDALVVLLRAVSVLRFFRIRFCDLSDLWRFAADGLMGNPPDGGESLTSLEP